MNLAQSIATSYAADKAFESALQSAGFRSRWHWHLSKGPESVAITYRAKVAADNEMHLAFVESRRAA